MSIWHREKTPSKRQTYRDVPHSIKVAFVKLHRKISGVRQVVSALLDDDPWKLLGMFHLRNWSPIPPGKHPDSGRIIPLAGGPRDIHRPDGGYIGKVIGKVRTTKGTVFSRYKVGNALQRAFTGVPLEVELDGQSQPTSRLHEDEECLSGMWHQDPASRECSIDQEGLEKLLAIKAYSKESLEARARVDQATMGLEYASSRVAAAKSAISMASVDHEMATMLKATPPSEEGAKAKALAQAQEELQHAEAEQVAAQKSYDEARQALTALIKKATHPPQESVVAPTDPAPVPAETQRRKRVRKPTRSDPSV